MQAIIPIQSQEIQRKQQNYLQGKNKHRRLKIQCFSFPVKKCFRKIQVFDLKCEKHKESAVIVCKNSKGKGQQFRSKKTDSGHGLQLLSAKTQHSITSMESVEMSLAQKIYDEAKEQLQQVAELRTWKTSLGKKMTAQIKLRITSFKEADIKQYEANICKFSSEAVGHILKCEKELGLIRKMQGTSSIEEKFYRCMKRGLAQDIREASRGLRSQQKDYFEQLRAYESGTVNRAIQLNHQEQEKMRDQFMTISLPNEQGEQTQRDGQITELVKSINQLSAVYKQLNELVIEQGSLIDRIDFNIEETLLHAEKANEHLEKVDKNVRNSCAQKCTLALIAIILVLAVVIGFKLSNKTA